MDIDRHSPLPKHFQLGEAIKNEIIRKGLSEGDAIPSERTLSETYDVSRFTVRRAISDLVKEGVLRREGRRGAYVSDISRLNVWRQGSRRRLLGVVIPDIEDFFAARLVNGMDSLSHQMGYSIALGRSDEDPDRAAMQLERLIAEQVAGVVLVPVACDNYVEANQGLFSMLQAAKVPFVLIDRYVEGIQVDTVVSDNFDGAYRCTKHLIDMGYRRVAYLGYPQCSTIIDRLAGYKKALMDSGIHFDDKLVVAQHARRDRDETIRITERLLRLNPPVNAIFTANDGVAMEVWAALRERGKLVPDEIALAGYDNAAGHTGPGVLLTTTEQPLYEEGRIACQMLLERIEGHRGEPRFVCLKSTFVPGHSTVPTTTTIVRDSQTTKSQSTIMG